MIQNIDPNKHIRTFVNNPGIRQKESNTAIRWHISYTAQKDVHRIYFPLAKKEVILLFDGLGGTTFLLTGDFCGVLEF